MRAHNGRFKELPKLVWILQQRYGLSLWVLIVNSEKLFEKGDLVLIKESCPIYNVTNNRSCVGIIVNEAQLLYIHDWETKEVMKEFWGYDVFYDGVTYKNVPQETLRKSK